jgi:putative transcriptional regulator
MAITLGLTNLRIQRRLSQRQLAALAGVRPDTISALERGDTQGIQFETLARLCEALQCTPGDILLFQEPDDHHAPVLGGPDEDAVIARRLAELDRAPRVDGPSFLAALLERAGHGSTPAPGGS